MEDSSQKQCNMVTHPESSLSRSTDQPQKRKLPSGESEQFAVPAKASKLNSSSVNDPSDNDASPKKPIASSSSIGSDLQLQKQRKRSADVLSQQDDSGGSTHFENESGEGNGTPSKRTKRSAQGNPIGKSQLSGGTSADAGTDLKASSESLRRDPATGEFSARKHIRKRTKFLLQAVLEQMEFYLSDSNLSKDRYVKHLLDQSEDGYIDLSVFGNFNKLQGLHKDGVSREILAKAIQRSKVLMLSEDKTRVRRVMPFKQISQEETDRRTIYVENLPDRATHAWIRSLFSQCGKVVYVSLPVYRTTREKKGFAFVEFETPEEAASACLLNNPPPEKAHEKPGKFPKSNKALNRLQKFVPDKPDQDSNEENISDDQKGGAETAANAEPVKRKKKKKGKKKKNTECAVEEKPDTVPASSVVSDTSEGKKKKKKKKKKRPSLTQDAAEVKKEEQSKDVEPEGEVQMESSHTENLASEDKERSACEFGVKTEPANEESSEQKRKKRKKRKKKQEKKEESMNMQPDSKENIGIPSSDGAVTKIEDSASDNVTLSAKAGSGEVTLSRKERKRLRQEDIRRKKKEREAKEELEKQAESAESKSVETRSRIQSDISLSSQFTDSESEDPGKLLLKRDGSQVTSILKSRKKAVPKRVEFDLVPETKEFIRGKEIRKRKKLKKEKLHLRIISKKEWDSLRAEYIKRQKSHMAALKESLRELRQQENEGKPEPKAGPKHIDLEDVFGTKRLKPTQEMKMAHVEALQFIPNVIVQWKCTHEIHRDKIRSMFKDLGNGIAYIDAQEEAKSGYIRFKDEESAEQFTKLTLTRGSSSFSARVLPAEQQQAYWDKANEDRMKRLGRNRREKGSERLARKVFDRNKATFFKKPSRIVFSDGNDDDDNDDDEAKDKEDKEQERDDAVDEGSAGRSDNQNVSAPDAAPAPDIESQEMEAS